jgi:hypothetical protein
MLRRFRFVVLVVALLAAPRLADACSCLAASSCRQYATAEVVVAGDVVDVSNPPDDGPPGVKVARLRVARAYKGPAARGQVVTVEMPAGSSASCSLDIAPGSRWVIYAAVHDGRLSTNLCQGSYGLERGTPWPALPPPGGVVSGTLRRYSPSADDVPLPGVPVWIATPGGRIAGKTDAVGAFRLTGVPAGTWTIEFDLGPSEQASQPIQLESKTDCAEVYAAPRARRQ